MKRVKNLKLELNNGREMDFEVFLDLRSMSCFEKDFYDVFKREGSFMVEVDKINQNQNITGIALLIGCTLHKEGKKQPVGVEFVLDNIDFMKDGEKIMTAIGACMQDLQPQQEQPKGEEGKQN